MIQEKLNLENIECYFSSCSYSHTIQILGLHVLILFLNSCAVYYISPTFSCSIIVILHASPQLYHEFLHDNDFLLTCIL